MGRTADTAYRVPRTAYLVKREQRLRRSAEIERVRKAGRSWAVGPVVLYVAPGPGPPLSLRSGFITGKKIGGAVERNLARRRLREAVRALLPRITPGWDLLWIARPSIRASNFDQICAAVQECVRRARLLDAGPPNAAAVEHKHEVARSPVNPVISEHD